MTSERLAFLAKQRARSLGFDAAGVTELDVSQHSDALAHWLDRGMAAGMTYMHRQAAQRRDPRSILPGTTKALVLTKHYLTPEPGPAPGRGRVAKYARGRDYHTALRGPLTELAAYLVSLGPSDTIARAFADTGPVPERELAQRAGLGWIAKNTMLIDPRRGSFSFIAVILTNLDLAPDVPLGADHCGSCRRCLDACPTGALPADRVLDARLCISYWTIEHRGEFPQPLEVGLGEWVFGCDVCQDVCPWNHRFARPPSDDMLEPDPMLASVDVVELASASDADIKARYGSTALMRAKPDGLRRNARALLGRAMGD